MGYRACRARACSGPARRTACRIVVTTTSCTGSRRRGLARGENVGVEDIDRMKLDKGREFNAYAELEEPVSPHDSTAPCRKHSTEHRLRCHRAPTARIEFRCQRGAHGTALDILSPK